MAAATYKAIIFDMGGVLIKTIDRSARTGLAKRFGMTYEQLESLVYASDSANQAMLGEISEKDHFITVLQILGNPEFDIRDFQEAFWGGDDIDRELISLIGNLKKQFKLGLLSNAMDSTRLWLNEKYDLLKLFDVCIFSGEEKMAKPGFEFYKLILDRLEVTSYESIFIDDFIENIEAANQLGFTTIHYKSTDQTIKKINELIEGK